MPLLFVVAAVLVDGGGRILVQQRPAGKSLAGLWEFPGGKIDTHEAPEAALVRELAEELGIAVADHAVAPATFASARLDHAHLIMLIYIVRQWEGIAEPLHACALRWCTLSELETLPMPPADAPLIPILRALL